MSSRWNCCHNGPPAASSMACDKSNTHEVKLMSDITVVYTDLLWESEEQHTKRRAGRRHTRREMTERAAVIMGGGKQ